MKIKGIVLAGIFAIAMFVGGRANATVSLLPGASWCPPIPFYIDVNQVTIWTGVSYTGTCQIVTIGVSNYGIPDLGAYGLNGPDYIQSIDQGGKIQGKYWTSTNYQDSNYVMNYGAEVWSTWQFFGGWYPASLVWHKKL